MHIDRDMQTVFSQLAAGTKIAYFLHLHVQHPVPLPEDFDERTIRVAVRNIMLPALNPFASASRRDRDRDHDRDRAPRRPFNVWWQMPNATLTCKLYYITEQDAAASINYLTVVTDDHDADMHLDVQEMVLDIERRVKREHPGCGNAWRLMYMLNTPVSDLDPRLRPRFARGSAAAGYAHPDADADADDADPADE